MPLQKTTKFNIDIASEVEIMSYTYSGDDEKQVVARALLGDSDQPIAGGGDYVMRITVNDHEFTPRATIAVSAGVTQAALQSRTMILEDGDVLKLYALGVGGDTDVNVESLLLDATPATVAQLAGEGAIAVDHNYGGADALRYVTGAGVGVGGAQVQAFSTEDYDAGNRSSAFLKGRALTGSDGRWQLPMMLDAGAHTLIFFKVGSYGPDVADVMVA